MKGTIKIKYLILCFTLPFCRDAFSQKFPADILVQSFRLPKNTKVIKDIVYAEVDGEKLLMDIYIPENQKPLSLVVWIHGGGWRKGSKENCYPALHLLPYGYAVASINYRLTGIVSFPAQLEDCKAAIRYLRANGAKYNINPERIGVWGASAGGHLAALLGTTGDIREFDKGNYLEYSSKVQAVCDYFGPSSIGDMPGTSLRNWRNSPESLLLIGEITTNIAERAAKASPISYVNKNSSPFFIVHGDKDNLVPVSQSEILYNALLKAGVEAQLYIIKGAGHGGREFIKPDIIKQVVVFFNRHLKGE